LVSLENALTVEEMGFTVSGGGSCHGLEQLIAVDLLFEIFFFASVTMSIALVGKIGTLLGSL
jgi:hypothetical protein